MSKEDQESLLSLTDRLSVWIENKHVVEVITDKREVTGVLTEVGTDYILVTFEREQNIETSSVGQDGQAEKDHHIRVHELEVLLKLEDITSISRVLKSRYK